MTPTLNFGKKNIVTSFFFSYAEVVGCCPFLFLAIQYKWASFSCLLRSSGRESRSCDSAAQLKWCALSCTPILRNKLKTIKMSVVLI
jgi:hypothetical protein